jgi:hypothetical protein
MFTGRDLVQGPDELSQAIVLYRSLPRELSVYDTDLCNGVISDIVTYQAPAVAGSSGRHEGTFREKNQSSAILQQLVFKDRNKEPKRDW